MKRQNFISCALNWGDNMECKFNINDRVKVKITPEGEKCWIKYYESIKKMGYKIPEIRRDEDGYTDMVLWSVMAMFGPKMMTGCDLLIETEIKFC